MPALDGKVIEDTSKRLEAYLLKKEGYGEPVYLASGGSAAIFRVQAPQGPRAFKAFAPKFFEGEAAAERRRLEIQRRLIGHQCPSLVQTFQVEEAEGTAFMEMEFVEWEDLNKVLAQVPDAEVASLIRQLVDAARFLEDQGIVHRDIKPENIKISPDFKTLKLLDLGVARNLEAPDDADAAITDHGKTRPFLATAQYSSPEYLFRLDEPSPKLWKGLSFYQIGAVLHDLIMKTQIFNLEMEADNRWLVTKAVLTKIPSFADGDINRLAELKALASRCLSKDLDFRLQTVSWEDFYQEGNKDPLRSLRGRLAKGGVVGGQAKASVEARLDFERSAFIKRFMERIRDELISACGTELPPTMSASADRKNYTFIFSPSESIAIKCQVDILWKNEVFEKHADLKISALLYALKDECEPPMPQSKPVCAVSIDANDEVAVKDVAGSVAKAIGGALDILEASRSDADKLPQDLSDYL